MKKSTTTSKRRTLMRTKKQTVKKLKKVSQLPFYALVGLGVLVLLIGGIILNFNLTEEQNANAQAPVPITKFTTTYKGYDPGNSWMSWLTLDQRCTKTQTIYGAKPSTAGTYPTLIYLHGATADSNSNKEGQRFIERVAAQGFVAMAVTYKSSSSLNEKGIQRHAHCIFNEARTGNGLTAACKVAGATCSNGVVLSGFSQGGAIAIVAKNYSVKVKAVWTTGVSAYIYPSKKIPTDAFAAPNGTRVLPNNKLVMNIGQSSNLSTKNLIPEDLPSLKKFTGVDCGTGFDCLQTNGTGYYVVKNTEIKDGTADHCYWLMVNKTFPSALSCTTSPTEFDPGFQPPSTTKWSMIRNLDWLRTQF